MFNADDYNSQAYPNDMICPVYKTKNSDRTTIITDYLEATISPTQVFKDLVKTQERHVCSKAGERRKTKASPQYKNSIVQTREQHVGEPTKHKVHKVRMSREQCMDKLTKYKGHKVQSTYDPTKYKGHKVRMNEPTKYKGHKVHRIDDSTKYKGHKVRPSREHHVDESTKYTCLLYTSPSPRDRQKSRMPSSA